MNLTSSSTVKSSTMRTKESLMTVSLDTFPAVALLAQPKGKTKAAAKAVGRRLSVAIPQSNRSESGHSDSSKSDGSSADATSSRASGDKPRGNASCGEAGRFGHESDFSEDSGSESDCRSNYTASSFGSSSASLAYDSPDLFDAESASSGHCESRRRVRFAGSVEVTWTMSAGDYDRTSIQADPMSQMDVSIFLLYRSSLPVTPRTKPTFNYTQLIKKKVEPPPPSPYTCLSYFNSSKQSPKSTATPTSQVSSQMSTKSNPHLPRLQSPPPAVSPTATYASFDFPVVHHTLSKDANQTTKGFNFMTSQVVINKNVMIKLMDAAEICAFDSYAVRQRWEPASMACGSFSTDTENTSILEKWVFVPWW